jgi:AbrB family looped-hinge helix DNA binding protein
LKIGKKSIFANLLSSFSVSRKVSVEIGKYGRILLPKKIRQKYGMEEGIRLIVTEYMGRICLIPVKKYEKPTEAIFGSIKVEKPIDEPKELAREHIRKKLLEDL